MQIKYKKEKNCFRLDCFRELSSLLWANSYDSSILFKEIPFKQPCFIRLIHLRIIAKL